MKKDKNKIEENKELEDEELEADEPKLETSVPWTALIICGVIVLLMIGCIITIVCLR